MNSVRVVKREDREAAKDSVVAGDEMIIGRRTPEVIVKSWISASRERRRTQAAEYLRGFREWDENRIVAVGQSA